MQLENILNPSTSQPLYYYNPIKQATVITCQDPCKRIQTAFPGLTLAVVPVLPPTQHLPKAVRKSFLKHKSNGIICQLKIPPWVSHQRIHSQGLTACPCAFLSHFSLFPSQSILSSAFYPSPSHLESMLIFYLLFFRNTFPEPQYGCLLFLKDLNSKVISPEGSSPTPTKKKYLLPLSHFLAHDPIIASSHSSVP